MFLFVTHFAGQVANTKPFVNTPFENRMLLHPRSDNSVANCGLN